MYKSSHNSKTQRASSTKFSMSTGTAPLVRNPQKSPKIFADLSHLFTWTVTYKHSDLEDDDRVYYRKIAEQVIIKPPKEPNQRTLRDALSHLDVPHTKPHLILLPTTRPHLIILSMTLNLYMGTPAWVHGTSPNLACHIRHSSGFKSFCAELMVGVG